MKLRILCEENRIDLDKVAIAVADTLNQNEDIYAELSFVSEEEIRSINAENRNIDSVTDVLSFPMLDGIREKTLKRSDFPLDVDEDENAIFLGSIVICVKRAEEQAAEYGHSLSRELSYLTVHGMLHLFGYDHEQESDKKQMRELEEQILSSIGMIR